MRRAGPTAPINPKSQGSRLVHFGYKVLLLALITYWNSGITRSLVARDIKALSSGDTNIASLEGAQTQKAKLCSQGSLGQALAAGAAKPKFGDNWAPSIISQLIVGADNR